MPGLPDVLIDLRDQLASRGYAPHPVRRTGTFGDQRQLLEGGSLLISIGVERSIPYLQISASGLRDSDWFDVDLWRSCLEDCPAPLEPRPLSVSVAYLLDHLGELERLTADLEALRSCLDVASRRRAEQRYGIQLGE